MESIKPLFSKIVERSDDEDRDILQEKNPFDDSDYLRKVNDQHKTSGHFSLIPRGIHDHHMSDDFECYKSDDDNLDYPFCSGQNFILSQQPS